MLLIVFATPDDVFDSISLILLMIGMSHLEIPQQEVKYFQTSIHIPMKMRYQNLTTMLFNCRCIEVSASVDQLAKNSHLLLTLVYCFVKVFQQ